MKFANGSFVGNIQSQSNESPASQGQLSGNYTDLRVIGYSGQFPILRGEVKFYRSIHRLQFIHVSNQIFYYLQMAIT